MGEVLVLGGVVENKLDATTGELLAAGRKLAEASGDQVSAALPGSGLDGVSADAIAQGADKVYLVQDPMLTDPGVETQLAAFEKLCKHVGPSVVLLGRTVIGRDLGPRLAFRLGAGLAQDCVDVWIDGDTGRVGAMRPVYGGNAMASVTFAEGDPQVVTMRPKAVEPLEPDSRRSGEVETFEPGLGSSITRTKTVEVVRQEAGGMRLEDAPVVISGGRGLGGPEPFKQLEELAVLLGGTMGASRAACDAGWLDHSHQVGLTGKTITPNLYITVGISGASQHMAGCSGAKSLVAINKDSAANIFKEADFGVVGDWSKVLPAFIETVRELVSS